MHHDALLGRAWAHACPARRAARLASIEASVSEGPSAHANAIAPRDIRTWLVRMGRKSGFRPSNRLPQPGPKVLTRACDAAQRIVLYGQAPPARPPIWLAE